MSAGAPRPRVSTDLGERETSDAFRLLVDQVADYAIYLLDGRGRVTSWNAGAQRIKGYAPGEIVGSHFSIFFTEEDRVRGKPAQLLEVAATEGRHGEEGWRVRKDGTRFWAHGVMTALRDESGELRGFAKITRDLSERLRAEEAARRLVEERTERAQKERLEQERRMMMRRQNELSALRADVSGVAASGCDSGALLGRAAAAVVERLGVAAAGIWIYDDDGALNLEAHAGMPLPQGFSSQQLRTSVVGRIADTGAPASSSDLSTDPGFGAAWDPVNRIAFDGCPLMAVGQAMGVLGAFGHGALPDDTLDALRGVADVVSRTLERRRAETEVQRSRDRLAVILSTISDGVTAQGKQGRLIFANQAAARITGFASPEEMVACDVDEIVARFEIRDELGRPVPATELPGHKALVEGQTTQTVVRVRNLRTNVERWTLLSAAPVLGEDGEVELAVNAFIDLSERKHAEEAWRFLAEAGATLASSLSYESTLAAVARLAVPRLADWCAVDLMGADGKMERLAVAGVEPERTDRASSTMLVPMTARDRSVGAITFVTAGVRPPYNHQDLVLAQEIARRAGLAIDNARAYREMRAAVQMRDTFLSIASHELKTPLSSLTLLLSGLLRTARAGKMDELGPEKVIARLERIDEQADRLTALMNQLLDVSRLAAGRFALAPEQTDLVQVAREVMARFREEAGQAGTSLELIEEGPVVGLWDRSRLDQVVTNLITNALKYGGHSPITVEVGGDTNHGRLSVADRGPGIEEADQSRIFEQYERAASTNLGGLGLGLWLVRQLARAHGGEVGVRSNLGEGAVFTVTLPRRMGPG
jgi:PAS domain S-box-containing protein